MIGVYIIEIQSADSLSISVKCAGVVVIRIADRRPTCKAACVIGKSAVSFQHPRIDNNIFRENCVCG